MAYQGTRLGRGKRASYDETGGYVVRARPIGNWRLIAFGLAFSAMFLTTVGVRLIDQELQRNSPRSQDVGSQSWRNPITDVSTQIDSVWIPSEQLNPDGQILYIFQENLNRALVVVGFEDVADDVAFEVYVEGILRANSANMNFPDGGVFSSEAELTAWQATGSLLEAPGNRVEMKIVRVGDVYWRLISIQAAPHANTDTLVERMQMQIWETIVRTPAHGSEVIGESG
jgi:hypothetical protein